MVLDLQNSLQIIRNISYIARRKNKPFLKMRKKWVSDVSNFFSNICYPLRMDTYMMRMNTCSMRYEYLHDENEYLCNRQLESISSWISFERENYVEDVRGFRFVKFLTDRQKYWLD